jgi:hypothetical protein
MTPVRHRLIALAAVLAALPGAIVAAVPARAATSGTVVVADCNAHGKLTATYSVPALQDALSTMTPAVKAYTNCYDVIQRALLAQVSGTKASGSDSGSSGSFLPTWLIVVIVIALLAAATLAAVAARRRRGPE